MNNESWFQFLLFIIAKHFFCLCVDAQVSEEVPTPVCVLQPAIQKYLSRICNWQLCLWNNGEMNNYPETHTHSSDMTQVGAVLFVDLKHC